MLWVGGGISSLAYLVVAALTNGVGGKVPVVGLLPLKLVLADQLYSAGRMRVAFIARVLPCA